MTLFGTTMLHTEATRKIVWDDPRDNPWDNAATPLEIM
jgi:hypothetical protein